MMLRSNIKVGGIIGLSAYLPLAGENFLSEQNKGTPIFLGHGDADQVVFFLYGKQSAEKLSAAGADVKFSTYPGMPHSACAPELLEVKEFIKKHLSE
ncbi:lysophospholipase-like protein [Dunaliella salina]|uniref:Lysophospholipase-like protein n=1 Tax=Dunaliella salina TaxID=3046 RepID=A0ABZ3KRM1_DUNSA|nr:lysophospholipase-like protein [Dunaliella salina]|eukprot:KAF5831819.1 lysophospholipase-like protein [Dunaliella salina]